MKRFPQKDIRFDESELKTDLGSGNTIFVGSSCDMWAKEINPFWQSETLDHCIQYLGNTYLFQTKNPKQFRGYYFLMNTILGTTIETNREYRQMKTLPDGRVPSPHDRAFQLSYIPDSVGKKMVTIEPVMNFDTIELVYLIKIIKPEWVNIGADSGGNNLPEPGKKKIKRLIEELRTFTTVNKKPNLKRLTE